MTSVSVIVPTAPWITRTLISSAEMRSSASCRASIDPCTSPFRMTRSSLTSPASICLCRSASVTRALTVTFFSCSWRRSAIWRALRSSSTERQHVPRRRDARQPQHLDRIHGAAVFTRWRRSLNIARTLP